MLQSIGASGSDGASRLSKMFAKLDANNDGTVDRAEFVAGKPGDVSADDAGTLFDTLDSGKTGALSQTDMQSAFQQMGSQMQSALIQAQSDNSTGGTGATGHHHGHGPDAAQMFSSLDTNGDGSVSKDEFVAGKPDGVNSDQASAFFDKISNGSGDSLTKDQFVSGLKNAGPPDRDGDSSSVSSNSSATSASSTDPGVLLDQLLAVLQNGTQSNAAGGSPPDASQMFSSLDTDGDGSVSKDEFVKGKPGNVSTDQASAFFDKISNGNGDSLTKDQFTSGLANAGPPDQTGGGSTASGSSGSSGGLTDGLTTAQTDAAQLLDQFIRAVGSYQNAAFQSRFDPTAQASSALLSSAVAA